MVHIKGMGGCAKDNSKDSRIFQRVHAKLSFCIRTLQYGLIFFIFIFFTVKSGYNPFCKQTRHILKTEFNSPYFLHRRNCPASLYQINQALFVHGQICKPDHFKFRNLLNNDFTQTFKVAV